MNIIYALVDPRTLLVRYVGQSSSGLKRPCSHAQPAQMQKRTHTAAWCRQLARDGLRPAAVVLEHASREHLSERECWWIAYGRALGWDLTNHTDGGEGTRGIVMTAAHRRHLSEAHTGYRQTEQHRASISAGNRGRVVSEYTREQTANANRARVWTPAMRAKMSASKTGKSPNLSAKQREHASAVRRGRTLGPCGAMTRAKISAALKGKPAQGRPRNLPRMRINLLPKGES